MPDLFDRRDFARRAALAAFAAGIGTASVVSASGDEPPAEPQTPAPAPHELLLEFLKREYPHEKLTPEILEMISADLQAQLGRSRALKSVPLPNGAAPFVFQAYRGE